MTAEVFGTLRDGTVVRRAHIAGGGLRLSVLSWGAAIQDLRLDGAAGGRPLVLGFDNAQDYQDHSPFFGAIVGRFANRIADGRFTLDGRTYQLSLNEAGRTHLHGGVGGFSERNWDLVEAGPSHVALRLVSEDGDQGYPGRVEAHCLYEIVDGALRITLTATTDAPTVFSMAAHSYFNLSGGGQILDHRLEVPADRYTPVDDRQIPTGELPPVEGTPYDFRRERPVREGSAEAYVGYDLNLVIRDTPVAEPRFICRFTAPDTGVSLEMLSTEPGLQIFDGATLNIGPAGLEGARYGAYAGFALEPQLFPDAPNHPNFTDATLRPGQTYRQVTEYRFSVAQPS